MTPPTKEIEAKSSMAKYSALENNTDRIATRAFAISVLLTEILSLDAFLQTQISR